MSEHSQRTYDFCLRFFVELKALGVTRAIVSPGSRSTPLALSVAVAGLDVSVQIDERVAGFQALGHARATGMPSVLVCTSGTAAANYLPAVVEANHGRVPMIICTADRPPELRGWGAGQTIEQTHLYGRNVRWFHELAVAGEVDPQHARATALRAAAVATGQRGPVHLNWPLREPLEPLHRLVAPDPTLDALAPPTPNSASPLLADLAAAHERGLIVAGPGSVTSGQGGEEVLEFARVWGWPILADPASGLRTGEPVVTTGELLLASPAFTAELAPCRVVVRLGAAPTSKAYRLWLEANRPDRLVLVDPEVDWADPTDSTTHVALGPLEGLFRTTPGAKPRPSAWATQWAAAERAAADAARSVVAETWTELHAVAVVARALESLGQAELVVSSSMPIRDLDLAVREIGPALRLHANRGANGIDGVVATAAGVAEETGRPTVAVVGDVATVHDLGGLAAAARFGLSNLTVVVIDNNGGGIFSMLPVASAVDPDLFDQLFATPHHTDIAAVASSLGFDVQVAKDASELQAQLGRPPGAAPRLVVVPTTVADTKHVIASLRAEVDRVLGALASR